MIDLVNELQNKVNLLDEAIKQFSQRGKARAEAERDYRTALAKAMLMERENGLPATILSDICRGKKDIADKKLQRDIADALYDSCKEAIQGFKLQIRVLEEAIQREWNQS